MPRIAAYGVVGWFLALQWTFSTRFPRPFDDWKEALLYGGASFFLFLQLWRGTPQMFPLWRSRWISWCLAAYGMAFLIALCTIGIAPYESLAAFARLVLWIGLAWWFSLLPHPTLHTLCRWSVGSAALIAAGQFAALHGFTLWPAYTQPEILAPIGHASYYGDFMAWHIPFACYLFFTAEAMREKLVWLSTILLLCLGLWIACSRASILGLCVGACLAIGLTQRHFRWRWRSIILLAVTCIGISLALSFYKQPTSRIANPIERLRESVILLSKGNLLDLTGGRWPGYWNTLQMIRAHPFAGWGLGTFRFVYPEYAFRRHDVTHAGAATWYMHPHNEILNQAVELGGLGLTAFLGLCVALLCTGLRAIRQEENPRNKGLAIVAFTALTLVFTSWQFNTAFLHPLERGLAALSVGILWRARKTTSCGEYKHSQRYLGMGLLTIMTLFLGGYYCSLYALAQVQRPGPVDQRLQWARTAYRFAPLAFDPLFAYSALSLNAGDMATAERMTTRLLTYYPFVPVALIQGASLQIKNGQIEKARALLQHALKNDPHFTAARAMLESLPPIP